MQSFAGLCLAANSAQSTEDRDLPGVIDPNVLFLSSPERRREERNEGVDFVIRKQSPTLAHFRILSIFGQTAAQEAALDVVGGYGERAAIGIRGFGGFAEARGRSTRAAGGGEIR
jgi:hypothetical protein